MNLLRRLGFTKGDELDLHIALMAVRSSWLAVLLALWVWATYDVFTKLTLTMPLALLMLAVFVYFSTDIYMRR